MPNQDNHEPADERKPVTVKDMSIAAWTVGLNAKDRHGRHSMADWLAKAIKHYAEYENRPMVEFPEQAVNPANPMGLVNRVVPMGNPTDQIPTVSLVEIKEAMLAAKAVSEAGDTPIPKTIVGHVFAILNGQLRAARGLPPLKPRKRSAPKQAKGIPFIEGKLQDQPGETRAEIG